MASTALLLPAIAGAKSTAGSAVVKHVPLLSVDGRQAVDLLNCTQGVKGVTGGEPYCPNLAMLTKAGVNYTGGRNLEAIGFVSGVDGTVTGATPKTMGVYYDVAYDRSLDAPAATTGNGVAAGPCTAFGVPTVTTTEYEEGIDRDQTKLNGGAPGQDNRRWRGLD